jgi:hypothetical protein
VKRQSRMLSSFGRWLLFCRGSSLFSSLFRRCCVFCFAGPSSRRLLDHLVLISLRDAGVGIERAIRVPISPQKNIRRIPFLPHGPASVVGHQPAAAGADRKLSEVHILRGARGARADKEQCSRAGAHLQSQHAWPLPPGSGACAVFFCKQRRPWGKCCGPS